MNALFATIIILGVTVVLLAAVTGYIVTTVHGVEKTNPVKILRIGMDSNLVVCNDSSNWSAVLYFPFQEKGTVSVKLESIEFTNAGRTRIEYYIIYDRAPDPDNICNALPQHSPSGVILEPGDKGYLAIFVPKEFQLPSNIPFYMNVIIYTSSGEIYLTVPIIVQSKAQ
ncbi:hypothetical protein PYJP_11120 [Pyrofollis japonicus]|uniref:hypothetical protein n=1 Tax=Pyrofollis japonicus TaxID=3060460 RepID=UPI00295AE764|nr:hypothetical protein [Pyrofollis japonicus]BEP17760.1 hypothetical protein PYJP_11120 [Pyrofollis japonicus]